jgi:hypothetical protein
MLLQAIAIVTAAVTITAMEAVAVDNNGNNKHY